MPYNNIIIIIIIIFARYRYERASPAGPNALADLPIRHTTFVLSVLMYR